MSKQKRVATTEYVGCGVLIRCDDGRRFLSHSNEILPSVFGYKGARKKALAHIQRLIDEVHISRKRMKVVRVKVSIEYECE